MALYLKDIFAAIAVVFNAIPMAVFSLSYGFAAFPTALGFIVTSFSDPFIGMVSGIALKYALMFLGGM